MKRRWLRCAAAILALAAFAAGSNAAAQSVEACLETAIPTNQLTCLSRLAEARGADDPSLCLEAEDAGARWMRVATYAEAAGLRRAPACCPKPRRPGRGA